jgi:hypothetical protein
MTPEEVARRYENLQGYDLVDYGEIGLPLWQLGVEALSVAHKRIQPIKEYVLRAVELNLAEPEIAGFLGLDAAVARGALAELASDNLLDIVDRPKITKQGVEALAQNGLRAPIEEQIQILFDGIMRVPVAAPPEELVFPRDIEDGTVVEIAALPPQRPTVADLSIADVDHVLQQLSGGRSEMGRDILRLKRVSRYRRIFRRGVGLVFKAKRGKDLRVLFVVSGVPNENLERRFAQAGGTSRAGFVRSFSDAYIAANVQRHLGNQIGQKLLDFSKYEELQRQVSAAKLHYSSLLRKVVMAESGELPQNEVPAVASIEQARRRELEAISSLENAPARPAAVYEIRELLARAFREAKRRVSISSKGLAPHLVNDAFVKELRRFSSMGGQVDITIHHSTVGWRSRGKDWERAIASIEELARPKGSLVRLIHTKEERYYHLAWDDSIALVCNRPLLSNQGRIKSFEQFAGFVLQEPSLVNAYLSRILG